MRTKNPPTHTLNYPLDPDEEAIITTIEAAAGVEYKGCYNREHPKGIGVLTHFVFLDPDDGDYHVLTHKHMSFFVKNNYFAPRAVNSLIFK